MTLTFIVGMAFCIERIIYLSLSEINAKKLMQDIDQKVSAGDVEEMNHIFETQKHL